MLIEYLNGDIPTLGTIDYKYYVPKNVNELNNVASLLVVEGNQIEKETGEVRDCEVQILHEERRTIIESEYYELNYQSTVTINIDYEESETEGFDELVAGFNIEEIRGNSLVTYYDRSKRISPTKPAEVESLTELVMIVNEKETKTDL